MTLRAHAIVASEHVVLDEPEAFCAKTIEPGLHIALRPWMSPAGQQDDGRTGSHSAGRTAVSRHLCATHADMRNCMLGCDYA
jgi:hypothetical protein